MRDEPDPPRKFYGLKPTDFTRVNEPAPGATPPPGAPDPGIPPAAAGPVDLGEIIRAASAREPGEGKRAPGENDVHAMLRLNRDREQAAGLFHVVAGPDLKRRRRIRNYLIAILIIDGGLGLIAWKIGPGAAIPFVCAIGAIGMFTAVLTWQTFFLRTD